MSGFNTIKKSRKRSHEIDEKLNVLNRELEKTKDIQEITMNTSDLYTPVVTTPPTEFQGPLDVPNTAGVGEDGFTQSSAGSGEEGHAPTYSSISDLKNSSVNRPIFQSPNDIEGAEASYGVVSYNLSGAGTNYGIIVDGNIVEGILSGFVAGGTRPASYYVDIYEAYLATNAASPGYYTDEQIAEKRIHAERAVSVENIRNSAAEKGLEFNIPWQGYRPPNMFADSTPYGTSYVHPTRGTLILAGFNLLGMAEKYHIGGDRGGTTAGDPKGTGDADQYPPLPFGNNVSDEAFDAMDELALGDDIDDDYFYIKDMYGTDAAEWFLNNPGRRGGNPHIPPGGYLPFFPFTNQVQAPTLPSPLAGAADGTEIAFLPFGGDKNDKKVTPPTKRTRKGTLDATKASTGMYPDMTPEKFFQKYGMSYDDYFQLNHFKPKGDLLKENAYMALLHRGIKPTESDYIRRGIKTPEQKKIFDERVKRVMRYARTHPKDFEFIMNRYPKSDPRLAMMNFKMDKMLSASDKYLETQFPTNQDLFTKVKDRTKKNMDLTNPKNFKPVKDPIKYVDVKKTKKLKETVTRHFNKPVKSKSMFGLNMGKVRKTNQKMIEKREQEQRIKEEDKAYIEERMSRQKSNWKDDLTTL